MNPTHAHMYILYARVRTHAAHVIMCRYKHANTHADRVHTHIEHMHMQTCACVYKTQPAVCV